MKSAKANDVGPSDELRSSLTKGVSQPVRFDGKLE